jgi:hypothetical protein
MAQAELLQQDGRDAALGQGPRGRRPEHAGPDDRHLDALHGGDDSRPVKYDDLLADLDGQMRRLAGSLEIAVPGGVWPALVDAATFERMRADAALAPAPGGIMKDPAAFFRRGTSGAGAEQLTEAELAHYHARAATMAPRDMLAWLHR